MADRQSRLDRWLAAARNENRYSLVAQDQLMTYLRTVPQLDAIGNELDGPARVKKPFVPCKPYLVDLEHALGLRIKGYRLFAPRHLFVFWQIDPMTSLILTMHLECEQSFSLGSAAAAPPPAGVYIPPPTLDDPVNHFRLTGHKGSLREELVCLRGYFFAAREEVLFDLGDGSLPVTTRI